MNRDGSSAAPLTSGPYDVYPSCTPDGKWLIYGDNHDHEHPQIRRVPINGGTGQLVAGGKFLASIHVEGSQSLQIFSTDPVKKTQTVPLPPDFFFYASFSADDKA